MVASAGEQLTSYPGYQNCGFDLEGALSVVVPEQAVVIEPGVEINHNDSPYERAMGGLAIASELYTP